MRVYDLIKELENLPQDIQITDTYENRIVYPVYKEDKNIVALESFDDLDMNSFLENFFEESKEEGMNEYDMWLQLGEMGVRLSDFEDTDYEEMAIEYSKTHDWEQ